MGALLADRRILVVGASSGIGRAIALACGHAGARVALAGRRIELLEEIAREVGPRATPLRCDVRTDEDCEATVAQAVASLGGLDGLVYSAGVSPLGALAEATAVEWWDTMATNVVGASLVTSAALGALRRSNGTAVYLSTISASATSPWTGLGLYTTSKAALDKLVEAWRGEHTDVTFCRAVVGPTVTEFGLGWDPGSTNVYLERWAAQGLLDGGYMLPEEVAAQVIDVLASASAVLSVTITARFGGEGSQGEAPEAGG